MAEAAELAPAPTEAWHLRPRVEAIFYRGEVLALLDRLASQRADAAEQCGRLRAARAEIEHLKGRIANLQTQLEVLRRTVDVETARSAALLAKGAKGGRRR